MSLRGSVLTNIAVAGTSIPHGLTKRNASGVADRPVAPTEYWVTPTIAQGAGQTYRYAAPDTTNLYFAQGTSATSAIVFFAYPAAITL